MKQYDDLQSKLATGWNTWNTHSVLCWVHLPEGFAINLGIKSYAARNHLREVQIGREDVEVGSHANDGSYSKLTITFSTTRVTIETGVEGDDLVVIAKPERDAVRRGLLIAEAGILWNHPGHVVRQDEKLVGHFGENQIPVFGTSANVQDPNIKSMTPYLALQLDGPAGISTGRARSLGEIEEIISRRRAELAARSKEYGKHSKLYDAAQTVTAWDTIYDPTYNRVITPVSRNWSSGSGGYVLCCWDTFFAAMIAAIDSRELAYANVVEVLNDKTPEGFVSNCSMGSGRKCFDRSQPPVGAITALALYQKFKDRWFIELVFDDLLGWNRWWAKNRFLDGYMCWGSNPFEPVVGDPADYVQPNTLKGAAYESGLDNSPMYDQIPFDSDIHLMLLADVGLMGLYAADTEAIAEMAAELGRSEVEKEMRDQYAAVIAKLQTLWHDEIGLFLNKRLDNGEFSYALSPTHFYPLIGHAATPDQAKRMVEEHLINEEELWGEWVIPSISRNDPAFNDGNYWRGRIWPPMNWLVYLGLQQYEFPEVKAAFADKSAALLLKEWIEKGHVHENYDADTGMGCGSRSYSFYHWGGLLGLIPLIENGLA